MHRNLDHILLRYTTGDMHVTERERFEAHLATCGHCQQTLAEWHDLASAAQAAAQTRAVSLPPLDVARLNVQVQGEPSMMQMNIARPRTLPFAYSALVAIVALSFVVVFGTMLMRGGSSSIGGQGAGSPAEVTPETTTTPLPEGARLSIPLVDVPDGYRVVVIALTNIDNGSVIDFDSLVQYALPERFVETDVLPTIDEVEGKIARTNIYCGQIISDEMLVSNARDVTPFMQAETLCSSSWGMSSELRRDNVFIMTEPVETSRVLMSDIFVPAGTRLDASPTVIRDYPSELVPQPRMPMAEHYMLIGQILTQDLFPSMVIAADMLQSLSTSELGTTIFTIQEAQIINGDRFAQGDLVDVSFTVLLLDSAGLDTEIESNNLQSWQPELQTPQVIKGAEVVSHWGTNLTLAVNAQDAVVLSWLIQAQVPLWLELAE